jgi:hypothetical protein
MFLRRVKFFSFLSPLLFTCVVLFLILHSRMFSTREKTKLGKQSISKNQNEIDLDLKKDRLVFYHIQKTSGTNWDLNMIKHLQVNEKGEWKRACSSEKVTPFKGRTKHRMRTYSFLYECRQRRQNSSLILSWHERHWGWPCGLHPTLNDLKSCVFKKFTNSLVSEQNFKFISLLRDPLRRFISEWKHVKTYGVVWVFDREPLTESQKCLRGINEIKV